MIRRATPGDGEFIAALGEEMFKRSHWSNQTYDRAKVVETAESLIIRDDAAVFISKAGVIIVLVVPLWFSSEDTAQELLFWSFDGRGLELRQAAEAWASSKGLGTILMGSHEPGETEKLERWYRRGGYEPHARIYRKALR